MSAPQAISGSNTDSAQLAYRESFFRLVRLGRLVWPAFFAVDLLLAFFVFPNAPLFPFVLYRAAGQAGIEIAAAIARRRNELTRAANRLLTLGTSTAIALMALHLGGITSPYMHGISVVVLVQSIVIPLPLGEGLRVTMPCALAFPVVMLTASFFEPTIAADLRTAAVVWLFIANYIFVLAMAFVGAVGSHTLWAARRQVFEARKLGRYRLEARIGKGGMNEIWLASDSSLRRRVALKILRTSDVPDERTIARFEREAHAMSALTSPNTVRVFDFGASDDGVYYIAMEHIDGKDLAQLVKEQGALPPDRVARIGMQICRSLAEAHEVGIVHRDVKPANVMLTARSGEEEAVKVVDFGIARIVNTSSGTPESTHVTVAGTPAYMAPEAWCGDPVDARSDIYSLGATLFFLLTGSAPFGVEHGGPLLGAHLEGEIPPMDGRQPVPPPLEAVVRRCLAKRPSERFPSVRAVHEALESAVDSSKAPNEVA